MTEIPMEVLFFGGFTVVVYAALICYVITRPTDGLMPRKDLA